MEDKLFELMKQICKNDPKLADLKIESTKNIARDGCSTCDDNIEYYEKSSENSKKEREEANNLYKQKNHNLRLHHYILSKYSRSAALAPSGSEELALAINNRSIFLMHIKKYLNSVEDIDYALSITKSEILISKLLCRKANCLLEMNQKDKGKIILNEAYKSLENLKKEDEKIKNSLFEGLKKSEKLLETNCKSYKVPTRENLEIDNINDLPYISESVSFNYDLKFGRHLLANSSIAAGEILMVEKLYCIYPDMRELYYTCSHCLKFCFNSIPCNNCVFAVYCSKECQKLAFEEYHDVECSINSELFKRPLCRINIILSRLYIKLIKDIGIEKMIEEAKILDNIKSDEKIKRYAKINSIVKNSNAFQFYYDLLISNELERDVNIDDDFPAFFLELLRKNNVFCDELSSKNVKILEKIFFKLMYNNSLNYLGINRSNYMIGYDDFLLETQTNPNGMVLPQQWNFINHNCYPNASKFYMNGGKLVVFASRPIKKNQQIYVTYGAKINMSKEQRKQILRKLKFECNCIVCTNNWPKFDEEMVAFFMKRVMSNTKENPDLANLITEFNCESFEDFDNWKHDKNKIKNICKILNKIKSKQPSFEEVAIVDETRYFLTHLFSVIYNDDFEIPADC